MSQHLLAAMYAGRVADSLGAPEIAKLRDATIHSKDNQGNKIILTRKTVNGRLRAHKRMNITGEQFDAMMRHLQAAMEKTGAPPEAQGHLTQMSNGTRIAIVAQPE